MHLLQFHLEISLAEFFPPDFLPPRSRNHFDGKRNQHGRLLISIMPAAKRMRKLVNRYPPCNIPFSSTENSFPLGSRRTSARPFTATRIPPATRRTPDTVFSRHEPAKVQAAYIIYTISRGVCRVRQNMKPASDAALR